MASPYRPEGDLRPAALAAVTAAVCGMALAAGAGGHFLEALLGEVPLAIALAQGALVGAIAMLVVRRARCHHPRAAGWIAAAAAALALVTDLYLDHRSHHSDEVARSRQLRDSMLAAGIGDAGEAERDHRARIAELTFSEYLAGRARRPGAAALTGLDLAAAMLLAGLLARSSAAEPACPTCSRWRVEQRLGAAAHGVMDEVVAHLQEGDAQAAAELLTPPDTREEIRLSLLACPGGHDGEAGVVRLVEYRVDRRRFLRPRRLIELEVDGAELAALRRRLEA